MDYISALEKALGKKAEMEMLPPQLGDMPNTYADVTDLIECFDYQPATPLKEGVKKFVEWYCEYYKVKLTA